MGPPDHLPVNFDEIVAVGVDATFEDPAELGTPDLTVWPAVIGWVGMVLFPALRYGG